MESMSHSTWNWISHLALKFYNNRNYTMGNIKKFSWEKIEDFVAQGCGTDGNTCNYGHKNGESFTTGKWSFHFKTCNKVSYFRRYPKIRVVNHFRHTCRQFLRSFKSFFRTISFSIQVTQYTCTCIEGED